MEFKITKEKSENMAKFSDKEWKFADVEHYGEAPKWQIENYYITATEDNEIVGMLHFSTEAGVAEILTLIVSHLKRNQGVGTALMQEAEKKAKELKAHKMFMVTGDGWKAVKFYEKMGFQRTGDLKNHFLKHDFIELTKLI